jgi:uncharacterized membrane protein YphA (DoxX/SURF4 family)
MKGPAPAVAILVRAFAGTVFLYAGFIKLIEPVENFRGNIAHYEIIPYALIPWIAGILPWIELFLGAALLLGFAVRQTGTVLAVLSALFLGVLVGSGSVFGPEAQNCGCFGQTGFQVTTRQVFFLDAINILTGLYLALWPSRFLSLDAWLSKP